MIISTSGGESRISFFDYQTMGDNSGACDDDMPYMLCYFEPDQFYSYLTDTSTSTIGKVKYLSIGGPCDIKFETIFPYSTAIVLINRPKLPYLAP